MKWVSGGVVEDNSLTICDIIVGSFVLTDTLTDDICHCANPELYNSFKPVSTWKDNHISNQSHTYVAGPIIDRDILRGR